MGLSSLSWLVLCGSVCHSIGIAFIILAVIAFIIGVIFMLTHFDTCEKDKQAFCKRSGVVAWVFTLIFATIGALMPSEKAVYMVAGIELVNQFSKTETAKELGDSGMSIVKDITQIIHNYTIDDSDRDRRR